MQFTLENIIWAELKSSYWCAAQNRVNIFEKDRMAFGNNQYLGLIFFSLSQLKTGEEKVLLVLLSVHQSGGSQLLYTVLSVSYEE